MGTALEEVRDCILSFLDAQALTAFRCAELQPVSCATLSSRVISFAQLGVLSHICRRVKDRLKVASDAEVALGLSIEDIEAGWCESLYEIEAWDVMRMAVHKPTPSLEFAVGVQGDDDAELPPSHVINAAFTYLRQIEALSQHTFPHRSL